MKTHNDLYKLFIANVGSLGPELKSRYEEKALACFGVPVPYGLTPLNLHHLNLAIAVTRLFKARNVKGCSAIIGKLSEERTLRENILEAEGSDDRETLRKAQQELKDSQSENERLLKQQQETRSENGQLRQELQQALSANTRLLKQLRASQSENERLGQGLHEAQATNAQLLKQQRKATSISDWLALRKTQSENERLGQKLKHIQSSNSLLQQKLEKAILENEKLQLKTKQHESKYEQLQLDLQAAQSENERLGQELEQLQQLFEEQEQRPLSERLEKLLVRARQMENELEQAQAELHLKEAAGILPSGGRTVHIHATTVNLTDIHDNDKNTTEIKS